jgi:uncharacterized protein (TIGR02118 family)
METTARITILWGQPDDPAAFEQHYRGVHIPLARKLPGLRRYTLSRNVASVRDAEPYYLVAELDFADMVALDHARRSPEGQATAADATALASHADMRSMTYELEDLWP